MGGDEVAEHVNAVLFQAQVLADRLREEAEAEAKRIHEENARLQSEGEQLIAETRARHAEVQRALTEAEAHELAGTSQPEAIIESRQALAIVAAELSRATRRAREVMEASLSNAAPHAEHAAALGVSVQRFRQVLCIIRARLRAAVEEATR